MSTAAVLFKRNTKLFFKDKAQFFTSLVTPAILLVLYMTFLANVFRDSFAAELPEGIQIPEALLRGLVGGQLTSSMLAVSCVTVAFCSNFLMVQDKVTGSLRDFYVTPVKPSVLSVSYYAASLLSTLLICFTALGICLIYLAAVGWYLSWSDVLYLWLDVTLLVLFGTALSSVIHFFLSTQGQISAVGTIISAGYGFICGAYMPISTFSTGLQKLLSFLPGTYATSLIRDHAMRGAIEEIGRQGVPAEQISSLRDSLDCNLFFFGTRVEPSVKYAVLVGSVLLLLAVYILQNKLKKR
ncbi:MAG: ABC transporter permease [Oscillospiraceae bacterium]|nr:ABC transporter permease [Oscillospiraceae bacterium]